MMLARLTDPHWVFIWKDPSAKEIIARTTDRVPQNLVSERDTKRHQKVIDSETGRVVGYARWLLPPTLADRGDVWLEAQVPEATADERASFEKRHRASTENGRPIGLKGGELSRHRSAPLEAADARIMQDGPFLSNPGPTYDRLMLFCG